MTDDPVTTPPGWAAGHADIVVTERHAIATVACRRCRDAGQAPAIGGVLGVSWRALRNGVRRCIADRRGVWARARSSSTFTQYPHVVVRVR